MQHGKRAAVAVALLVEFGLAREVAPRDESSARALRLPAKPAPAAREARPPFFAGAAPGPLDSLAISVKSGPSAIANARTGVDASVPDVRRLAVPPALPHEPEPGAAGSSFRILLEPLAAVPGAVTASFSGRDTGAPRVLELWRVGAGRPQRLGRAVSDGDARIHGPQLALPAAGIALVVTPLGVQPGEPGASQPLQLSRAPDPDDLKARRSPRWRVPEFPSPSEGEFR